METTWFSVSYREWLREGPFEATATGRTLAMLVLTPPGLSGRDKIVHRTSLLLYCILKIPIPVVGMDVYPADALRSSSGLMVFYHSYRKISDE